MPREVLPTGWSPLIYQGEPVSPAKKRSLSEWPLAQGPLTRDHSYSWPILRHCNLNTRDLLFYQRQHHIRDMLRPVLNPGTFEFIEVLLSKR